MRQGQHVVFYEVDAEGNVLVVRVLHRRMLPALHLT
jgi:plasmid stabilization system protein ParE